MQVAVRTKRGEGMKWVRELGCSAGVLWVLIVCEVSGHRSIDDESGREVRERSVDGARDTELLIDVRVERVALKAGPLYRCGSNERSILVGR